MRPIQKILVACDLSKFSDQVLDYATVMARSTNAVLILANIINQRDVDAIEHAIHQTFLVQAEASPEAHIRRFKAEREERLYELIGQTGHPSLFLKTVIRTGVPFQELIHIVSAEHADLVVMGTKGRTNLSSVLLGGTAEKMFRHCPVPLLSVRLHKN